jgi:ABC-type Fe3+/spermidine/putrescine transport system ATPase subunit
MMGIIELDNLSFSYGTKPILEQISLTVEQGMITVLLGHSGCGKSSLLRLIAGFETPTAGVIKIAGRVVSQHGHIVVPPDGRELGMVFQDLALWPHMRVAETLDFVLRAIRCPAHQRSERIEQMIQKASLQSLARAFPSQLSGGQQQLLALARAMITRPTMILMDEPLSSLDVSLREQFIETLLRLAKDERLSILYVTHDQVEAFSLADRIVVMNRGRVDQVGTPDEVYHSPATDFVRSFIGMSNFLEGSIFDDGEVRAACGTIHCETSGFMIGERVQLIVRAEDLHLQQNGTGEIGGIVDRKIYTGAGIVYHVDVGGCVLKARSADEVQKGERVTLRVICNPTIRRLRDENKTEP